MRRPVTWLVVLALGTLGLAAGVDALRGGPKPERPARQAEGGGARAEAAARLRAAGVRGALTYADADCRVHTVSLPGLEPRPVEGREACEFRFSPAGELHLGRGAAAPGLKIVASCRAGAVEVRHADGGDLLARARGCAPAWKPDGTATFARGGAVFAFTQCSGEEDRPVGGCATRLLSREDVRTALLFHPEIADYSFVRSVRITALEWLTDTRLAALLVVEIQQGPTGLLLAFYEGRRAVGGQAGFNAGSSGIRVSPSRELLGAAGPGGLRILARDGRPAPVPEALFNAFGRAAFEPLSLAWSADEAWLAVAARASIYVVPAAGGGLIRIPIAARDLAWR